MDVYIASGGQKYTRQVKLRTSRRYRTPKTVYLAWIDITPSPIGNRSWSNNCFSISYGHRSVIPGWPRNCVRACVVYIEFSRITPDSANLLAHVRRHLARCPTSRASETGSYGAWRQQATLFVCLEILRRVSGTGWLVQGFTCLHCAVAGWTIGFSAYVIPFVYIAEHFLFSII